MRANASATCHHVVVTANGGVELSEGASAAGGAASDQTRACDPRTGGVYTFTEDVAVVYGDELLLPESSFR